MERELSLLLYLFCFIFSSILMYNGKKKNINFLVFFSLLIPICLAGFRYFVGTDYSAYLILFNKYAMVPLNNLFNGEVELSFLIICKIANLFNNPRIMFGIYGAITLIFSYFGIKKLSNNKSDYLSWMFLIYLFNFYIISFNIMRQGAALAICLYALSFIFDRKLIKYVFWIVIAFFFHKSAIIMLPLYFIYDNKKGMRKQIIICLIATVLIYYFDYFLNILTTFEIFNDYSVYTENLKADNKTVILNILICFLFYINYKKLYSNDEKSKFFITMYTVGTLISFLGFKTPFLKRVADYFFIACIPLFPKLYISQSKSRNKLLMIFIILVAIIGPFIISIYILNHANLLPYRTN